MDGSVDATYRLPVATSIQTPFEKQRVGKIAFWYQLKKSPFMVSFREIRRMNFHLFCVNSFIKLRYPSTIFFMMTVSASGWA